MKKKILFASRDLSLGGMEKALVSLLDSLDYDRYDVTLVLERAEGALLPKIDSRVRIKEYRVCDVKAVPVRRAINLLHRLRFMITDGNRYDFSCTYATYSDPCRVVSLTSSKNSMLYVHSDYVSALGDVGAREFFGTVHAADYSSVAFVSDGAREAAERVFPEICGKCVTVGNIPDTDGVRALAKEKTDDIPKRQGEAVFCFVGRLDDSSKKLDRLTDALSILKREGRSPEVWTVGDGPDGERYKRHANEAGVSDMMRFFGARENPYPYMAASDCLVLCSDFEGFPVVYGEAAALSLPVVTTVPVSDGTFTVDDSCAYIAKKTPEGVACAMRRFMDDADKKVPFADTEKMKLETLRRLDGIM